MSEARTHRFEIDIDEIERQLRRSIEEQPAAKPDPLAELARIVGQDDPFRGILPRDAAQPAPRPAPQPQAALPPASHGRDELPPNVHVFQRPAQPALEQPPAPARYDDLPPQQQEPAYAADPYSAEPQIRAEQPAPQENLYDPVSAAYGSQDAALAEEDFKPLHRRRSRGRLAVVMAGLLVTVGAVAGGLYLRSSGSLSSGPKLITADTSPLKVAPENPGGLHVPNQDRKIYEQPGTRDVPSRVVDGREQPIDVRAAARNMPAPVTPAPTAPGSEQPAAETGQGGSTVASALGEPRRVRTVAVNPDGSQYGARTPVATSPSGALVPGGEVPSPVSVTTVPVGSDPASAAPAPPVAEAPAPTAPEPAPPPAIASAGEPSTLAPVMDVMPPRRPRFDAPAEPPVRTAALPTERPSAERPAAESPAAGRANFSVQIAVRSSEQEAREAWGQAQDKFGAALENKPARLTTANVGGRTVHRVRLGPMTKTEADAMCARLKTRGGACFVAQN
ncbi:SPOR domain-containing protein [Enterovirga rhinocerotis]|uniref:Sporulation related protein n=1 Tax=Enterovirga rhinocerotis TaxID=1339210 RepID=A0A4R7CD15_9HYPH|nr:SPOR domain-containing protein [Enterovirga rhinocerotis]TDR94717.1 sporulation related protein [Enterovirga rhinocerotis]